MSLLSRILRRLARYPGMTIKPGATFNLAAVNRAIAQHPSAGITWDGVAPPPAVPSVSSVPIISGGTTVGAVLSFTPAVFDGVVTTRTTQWTRDGVDIAGATGATYTTTAAGAHRVRETATNVSGSTPATSNPVTVAAAALDSRARFGYGTATAGVASPTTLLASMAVFGASNASKAGTFTSAPGAGQYAWAAFEAGASAAGVTFTVALGPGGWQGASSAGANTGDDGSSPNTSTVTATIGGVTWRFFRTSFANAADDWTTS